jgi:hypothetical protein
MTTTGFMSGPRAATRPTRCSRSAAVLSLLLGVVLVLGLPALAEAAFYVGVLATALAAVALGAGAALWAHDTIVVRAGAAFAAGPILLGEILAFSLGLPGAREVADLTVLQAVSALVLAGSVLALLVADAFRRRPEEMPDSPYAL